MSLRPGCNTVADVEKEYSSQKADFMQSRYFKKLHGALVEVRDSGLSIKRIVCPEIGTLTSASTEREKEIAMVQYTELAPLEAMVKSFG